MAKAPKTASYLVSVSGWVSSVFPVLWGAMLTSIGGVVLLFVTAGAQVFTSPNFIGACVVFVMILWSYIGIIWLATRKPKDIKHLRYGITFEGVSPVFNPANNDAALSFFISIRNFSPSPIRYFIEEFEVYLDTRTLPSRYQADSLQGILPRAAGKMSSVIPFKLDHIKEFLGKRVEGEIKFSIKYGDADRSPVRRLRMSHKLYIDFPNIQQSSLALDLPVLNWPQLLGFTAIILSESDDPI